MGVGVENKMNYFYMNDSLEEEEEKECMKCNYLDINIIMAIKKMKRSK